MAKIDWTVLGTFLKGLAVEGKDDKLAIEAFLDAGEKSGQWSNWRSKIHLEIAGDSKKVLNELDGINNRVWGLIDRDWRTNTEISDFEKQYPQLLVLPRITIENYCIDPDELNQMLPPAKQFPTLNSDIGQYKDDWIQNGALWQVMYDNGANDFCRGHEDGYPKALLFEPVTTESEIETKLQFWYQQLDPAQILPNYRKRLNNFRSNPADNYKKHVHGKHFFNRIVVKEVLNRKLPQQSRDAWFKDLFSFVHHCPSDLVPVLQKIFA